MPCNLPTKLEAKQDMEKAEWDFWKEADKQREALDLQSNGPLLFEWDGLSEEALQDGDKCLRQRWNAYKDRLKEMVTTSLFDKSNEAQATNPSPPYHQIGSHAEESDKKKMEEEKEEKGMGNY